MIEKNDTRYRSMKNILKGAVTIGVLFALSGCAVAGPIQNKRAPGIPGEKTFQLQITDSGDPLPGDRWITVSEHVWDLCGMGEDYPKCAVDGEPSTRVASK
jgi:predicted small lipoprotein YifL